MFGYGGDKQMHHTKGRRRELANICRAKKIPLITFDGGVLSSFGNVSTSPEHHFRVALTSFSSSTLHTNEQRQLSK